MSARQYLPTFSDLVDRLTICQLKAIFIPENKEAYEKEIELIIHDIDEILDIKDQITCARLRNQIVTGRMIHAIVVVMLANREIWLNESKARATGDMKDSNLIFTHSINGIRNTAKNIISQELGERVDLKIDCLAADLVKEFGNWNIFHA